MNWCLGSHPTVRTGIKQSLSHAYQVWCPHVAQAPRVCAKQAQATGIAAPSYAPGVSLAESHADATTDPTDASSDAAGTVLPRHAGTWTPDRGNLGIIATCAGGSSASSSPSPSPAAPSGPCRGHAAPLQHPGPIASNFSILTHTTHHTRPPADRTAEASTSSSASGAGLGQNYSGCSSHSSRKPRRNSAVGSRASTGSVDSGGKGTGRSRDAATARPSPSPSRTSSNQACHRGESGGGGGGGGGGAPASSTDAPAEDDPAAAAAAAAAPPPARQPLTLERLRDQTPDLRSLDLELLRQRLGVLCGILQLDATAALQLCRVVPGLLAADSPSLQRSWRRLCASLGGEEPARGAASSAPLLLVLPSDRVPLCVASLAAATGLPRPAAAALVAEWPQLATHAPASLAAKLEGLRRLLASSPPAEPAPPAALRAALRAAPRLLTFSTSALQRHHEELSALLGSPERLRAALAREPGLLAQRPATVAAKLALLRQLMDCGAQPGAVAALVVRAPGLLRRSLAALSAGCRALSVWQFRRRDKLRMVLSRPGLLALAPREVHGRCRWLRRLMLSNAYYHAALRRLPPSLVGVVVAALPQAWARLQYLAESSQECRMCVMDVVECRQEDFEARFPEFDRWLQFKIKLMGAENPWRGALRIRGFNSAAARERPAHGAPNQLNLLQRQQRQRVARRPHQRQQQQQHTGPSVPVVLAEAGEVRSGGSTVSRPRRVLRQPQTAAPPPPSPALAAAHPASLPPPVAPPPPLAAESPSGPPALLILPTGGIEVAAPSLPPPLPSPSPPAGARKRLPAAGREVAAPGTAMPAAAAAAAGAELPR